MRIRKNSRLILGGSSASSSLSASPSPSPSSFLICQLNRSPWDVLDAFSLQGEWGAGFEYVPASDSFHSGESMELSFEYVEKPPTNPKQEEREENGGIEDETPSLELEAIKMPLLGSVDRHIPASHPPPLPPKKAAATTPKRRGRPKKAATSTAAADNNSNNNPYEFYYYSGFGPRWAKRRGCDRGIDGEKLEYYDPENKTQKKKMKEKAKKEKEKEDNGVPVDEEIDFIDDDDDDEDEDSYGGGELGGRSRRGRSSP